MSCVVLIVCASCNPANCSAVTVWCMGTGVVQVGQATNPAPQSRVGLGREAKHYQFSHHTTATATGRHQPGLAAPGIALMGNWACSQLAPLAGCALTQTLQPVRPQQSELLLCDRSRPSAVASITSLSPTFPCLPHAHMCATKCPDLTAKQLQDAHSRLSATKACTPTPHPYVGKPHRVRDAAAPA